jgi:adenylyltransferase and sulfurtransferase
MEEPTVSIKSKCASLRAQISTTELRLAALKQELHILESSTTTELRDGSATTPSDIAGSNSQNPSPEDTGAKAIKRRKKWPLEQEEYQRYGRQMIVPQIGLSGQYHSCLALHMQRDITVSDLLAVVITV